MLKAVKRYLALIHSGEALPLAEKHCRPQNELANAQIRNGCVALLGGVLIPWLLHDTMTSLSYVFLFIGLIGCTVGILNRYKHN